MTLPLPSLFVSHGAPDLVLTDHPAAAFLGKLGQNLPRPRAILIVSAHWERPTPAISTGLAPDTIHDFTGWPRELYALNYPAQGAPWLADRAARLLKAEGYSLDFDPSRGLDHGAWVPLMLGWPDADVPVAQLSLLQGGDARAHFALGRALAPLRKEGLLVIGSGSAVHNLRALAPEGTPPAGWAQAFDAWLTGALINGDCGRLLALPDGPPGARLSHPTPEHLMPLFVALGAGNDEPVTLLHDSWSYGSLSMRSYGFGQIEVLTSLADG